MWVESVSREEPMQEGKGGQEGGVVKAGESKVGPVDIAETHSPAT